MDATLQILIPEATANEFAGRVLKNSHVTMASTLTAGGMTIDLSCTAKAGFNKLVFLDPPAPRQVELQNLDVSGDVTLTRLRLSVADFLSGAGVPNPLLAPLNALPPILVTSGPTGSAIAAPFHVLTTLDCQPKTVPPPAGPDVVISVAVGVPPVQVNVGPMGPVVHDCLANAARTALSGVSVTLPVIGTQHLPGAVINAIVANITAAWDAMWANLGPLVNQAVAQVVSRLQIFQQDLALVVFRMPATLAIGAQEAAIPPVDVVIAGGKLGVHFTANGGIPGVSTMIKNIDVKIAHHLMTVTLLLS